VILVEEHGILVGLITVKDVLRFTAMEKPDSYPSWDERGGLDGMLEEIWTGTLTIWVNIAAWSRRLVRR
jgi:chloride channel 3/4/5